MFGDAKLKNCDYIFMASIDLSHKYEGLIIK